MSGRIGLTEKALKHAIHNTPYQNAGKLSFDYMVPTKDDLWGNPLKGGDSFRRKFANEGGVAGWINRVKLNEELKDAEEDNTGSNIKTRERQYQETKKTLAKAKEESLNRARRALEELEGRRRDELDRMYEAEDAANDIMGDVLGGAFDEIDYIERERDQREYEREQERIRQRQAIPQARLERELESDRRSRLTGRVHRIGDAGASEPMRGTEILFHDYEYPQDVDF